MTSTRLAVPAGEPVRSCALSVGSRSSASPSLSPAAAPTTPRDRQVRPAQSPPLSELALFPSRLVAAIGEPIALTVTARDVDGAAVGNVAPQYVSTNPDVVRVDPGPPGAASHLVGRHASSFTMSDIAMSIGPKGGGTLLSYFETMTDPVFADYQARGVPSRQAAIITREERDADPVPCVGEQQFTVQGSLPDWVDLN